MINLEKNRLHFSFRPTGNNKSKSDWAQHVFQEELVIVVFYLSWVNKFNHNFLAPYLNLQCFSLTQCLASLSSPWITSLETAKW